jgi:hypothetical protein
MKNIHELKDKAILLGWIVGLLFFISLIWILTKPLQVHYLSRTVNTVLVAAGDSRRITEYVEYSGHNTTLMGHWFSMHGSTDKMYVFTFFQDGILVPLAAIVSYTGSVSEVIPLSAHATQVFDYIPQSILKLYITRIESMALYFTEGQS